MAMKTLHAINSARHYPPKLEVPATTFVISKILTFFIMNPPDEAVPSLLPIAYFQIPKFCFVAP
jgi:hypothetical protein